MNLSIKASALWSSNIITQGHAFDMFSCKQQCISALGTCRRHVSTLWRYCVWEI